MFFSLYLIRFASRAGPLYIAQCVRSTVLDTNAVPNLCGVQPHLTEEMSAKRCFPHRRNSHVRDWSYEDSDSDTCVRRIGVSHMVRISI